MDVGSSFDYAYDGIASAFSTEGTLRSNDQYYKVGWSEGQAIAVSIRGNPGTNFDVYIYDGARRLIASATGTSYPDTVAFVTGSWPTYIKVHPRSGSGEYRLQHGRPSLDDHNVSPVYVRPGQTFLVGYKIRSPFYDNIQVGLGCSIRSPSNRVIDDPSHDVLVSVSYGTNWYYRSFTVPLDAEEGWYDVSWAIWGKYSPSSGFDVEFDSDWWVPDQLYVSRTKAVNFQILDEAGSAVSGASLVFAGSSYSHGSSINIAPSSYSLSTGIIPSGYRFRQWETSGGVSVISQTSPSTTATVSEDGTITMRLQRTAMVTFSVTGMGSDADASGTILTVDGVNYAYADLPKSFTWDVGSSHSFSWSDPVSAGSDKRYVWVSTSGLSTAKSGTINVPSDGGSISSTYKTQYTLTINVNPPSSGSTNPTVGTYWYDYGSDALISATSSVDYIFQKWQLDGSDYSTNNPVTVTINEPYLLTAYFAKIQTTTHYINVDNRLFLVIIKSNSIISNMALNKEHKKLTFNVEGLTGTEGICNVTVPKDLLNANIADWNVLIDGTSPKSLIIKWNQTHTFIYFTYTHSTHLVEIKGTEVVPEFNIVTMVLAFTALTTLTIAIKKEGLKHRLRLLILKCSSVVSTSNKHIRKRN
ncbi:MAG: hypothetical protein QW702_00400 [Candidatus Bathyarchaeia archaeon]